MGESKLLKYVSSKLTGSSDFMLQAIERRASAFRHAADVLRLSKAFVLDAAKVNGRVLCYAIEFSADREVVMAAVRSHGNVIQYASPLLQQDLDIARAATEQSTIAALHLCRELRT